MPQECPVFVLLGFCPFTFFNIYYNVINENMFQPKEGDIHSNIPETYAYT